MTDDWLRELVRLPTLAVVRRLPQLVPGISIAAEEIVATPRIGISRGMEQPWRYNARKRVGVAEVAGPVQSSVASVMNR